MSISSQAPNYLQVRFAALTDKLKASWIKFGSKFQVDEVHSQQLLL